MNVEGLVNMICMVLEQMGIDGSILNRQIPISFKD